MNKLSIGIVITLLLSFCLIIWATDAVSESFGKTGEILALGAVALMLFVGLIKTKGDK